MDLKQTHKAELIFNLVLFNFLKIKSSLSKLFKLSLQLNAVDSHLGERKVKTSTTQMQRVGRRAQGPSRSSGLLSRGSMGPRDSHPGNVPSLNVSVKKCIPEPAQFNIVERIFKKFMPLGMLNLCPKISTENKGQDYAGLGFVRNRGRPAG